jgi:uncharacterized small protein (DUF1192 family)
MPTLTYRQSAAKARVLAEIASGSVGFLARMMSANSPDERLSLGKQADAELLARDAVIRQKEFELGQKTARIALLEAEIARLRNR